MKTMTQIYTEAISARKLPEDLDVAMYVRFESQLKQFSERYKFTSVYGWCLPTYEFATTIAKLNVPFVSLGSGSAFLEMALRDFFDIDVVATDACQTGENRYGFNKSWMKCKTMGASTAVNEYKDRAVLLSWPCYDEEWAYHAIKQITQPERILVYIGESTFGCCAERFFFEELEANFDLVQSIYIPNWSGIHDSAAIYKRKSNNNLPKGEI